MRLSNKALGKAKGRKWRAPLLVAGVIIIGLTLSWNVYVSTHLNVIEVYYADSPQSKKNKLASILTWLDNKQSDTSLFSTDEKPFLVVCRNVDKNSLLPTFSNFSFVRLGFNETPPPWNATVFLHAEKCLGHPYVQESIRRREKSSFVFAPSLNLNLTTDDNDHGSAWVNGVHWPDFRRNQYLREIHNRPAILKIYGEVFWRNSYKSQSCQDVDFVVYRENENPPDDCLTIHFLQGVTTTTFRGEDEFGLRQTADIFKGTVTHPHKYFNISKYNNFCSFIVRYNSSKLVHMFNNTYYDTDALVRHMFFLQLSDYKPCTRISDCGGSPYNAFKCMKDYKFHITMENTMINGYVTEKLFNGALAGGIPVYFGATDIHKYVNPNSFIQCNVAREVIEEMRSFYPRRGRPRPFLFNFSTIWPTEEELLAWADSYLRSQLEPCVQRVISLDENDEEYKRVLREPFITNDDIMNGMYPLRGVALAYNLMRYSEMTSDFVKIPGHSQANVEELKVRHSKELSNEDRNNQVCPGFDRMNTALSFVFAGRNDNYVGIYNQMKVSIGVLLGQLGNLVCDKKRAEIIIVSWGDAPSRNGLMKETVLPAAFSIKKVQQLRWENICVRVIKIPSNYTHDGFMFSEFVAKNIGIRRASGSWIVASNLDNFLSSELLNFAFNSQNRLSKRWYLRAMRFNINITEGSVLWARGSGYERVTSLAAPVDALSLLDWMSLKQDGYSSLEREYEGKNFHYLNHFDKFDKICVDQEVDSGAIFFDQYPKHEYSGAAGDFTMASMDAWHQLYGYPEVYDNNHLDGLQLCRFLQAGMQEVVLRPNRPCSAFVFHQWHDEGRGGRKESNIGAVHGCATEVGIESRLDNFVNKTGWGHPFDVFQEDVLIFKRSVDNFKGVAPSGLHLTLYY